MAGRGRAVTEFGAIVLRHGLCYGAANGVRAHKRQYPIIGAGGGRRSESNSRTPPVRLADPVSLDGRATDGSGAHRCLYRR